MLIKQKCQKYYLKVTIKWTSDFWQYIFGRNKKDSVESLKRCLSVGEKTLTCIGVDNVFVGHKSEDGSFFKNKFYIKSKKDKTFSFALITIIHTISIHIGWCSFQWL